MTAAGGRSPLDLAAVNGQLNAAFAEVRRMCQPGTRWHMTIPVDPGDSDEVLTHALLAAQRALKLLRETRAALYPYVVSSQPSSTLLDRALAVLAQAVEGG